MRRRVLESESQGGLSSITGISVDIPTEEGITYSFRSGDKIGTEFRLTYDDFPFRFEPTPPNYFISADLSVSPVFSSPDPDPGSLNGKSIDIYYFCKDSSIFTGWDLLRLTINSNTLYEDDPDFPHIYTNNGDGFYRFRITLPTGLNNKNIIGCSMRFQLNIDDDALQGSHIIYISL